MGQFLSVALVQSHLIWEAPEQNRTLFDTKIKSIGKSVDIIVLPEMFTSGFTMNASLVAERIDGETLTWLKQLAKATQAAITGSIVISEQGKFYNRLVFVEPSGKMTQYDKKHTFTLAGEDKVYTAGKEKIVFDYKGWRICPLICYDLRFPVWARNTEDYDLLLYVANWPKPRINAWDALLKARAIENMSYCIGVNRIGLDANNYDYPGHSACYDVLGKHICAFEPNEDATKIVTLNKSMISKYRNRLGFLKDRDNFSLEG